MIRFTTITLGMVALLSLALIFGGLWAALALAYITIFTYFMDRFAVVAAQDHPGQEFPAGHGLSITLGIAHFPLLFGGVFVLASDVGFTTAEKVLIFLSLSLFLGQVSNSNAHELIHRPGRGMRRLGCAIYCSVLFGHHASAHVLVHHVHAATSDDPNTARPGEHFYAFAIRAWRGALIKGFWVEAKRKGFGRRHPYWGYAGGAMIALALSFALAGSGGIMALIAMSLYAQAQLLLSDYVQHYGLMRHERVPGRIEPVGPHHSWNAPHSFSAALMLNAPRHSDHHARPALPYPGLELDRASMPILPHSLPLMAVIALCPPLWFKLMDKRVARLQDTAPAQSIGKAVPG